MLRLTNAFIILVSATLGACSGVWWRHVTHDQQAGAPSAIDGQNAGVSIQRTFATAGNYHYTCHIHPGMQGTVVVQ